MKITVVGAGGIGGLQGAWMARAGYEVTLVDIWDEHVEAINAQGLRIDGARGRYQIEVPAVTSQQLDTIAPLDTVIVAVKSYDTRLALEQLLPYGHPETCFVSMQAGLNLELFADLMGSERTLGAVPNYGGALVGPGHLEVGFPNYIHIGELSGRITPRVKNLARALSYFTPTHISTNITGAVWSKQVYSSQILCSALVDAPYGAVWECKKNRKIGGWLVWEAIQIAQRAGIILEPFDFFDPEAYRIDSDIGMEGFLFYAEHAGPRHEVFRSYGYHPFKKTGSGLHFDRSHRRRSETPIDASALLNRAEQVGLEVPLNRAMFDRLNLVESGKEAPGQKHLDELWCIANDLGYDVK